MCVYVLQLVYTHQHIEFNYTVVPFYPLTFAMLRTKCCYGLSMDILDNVATELGFEFHLYIVRDELFGAKHQPTMPSKAGKDWSQSSSGGVGGGEGGGGGSERKNYDHKSQQQQQQHGQQQQQKPPARASRDDASKYYSPNSTSHTT